MRPWPGSPPEVKQDQLFLSLQGRRVLDTVVGWMSSWKIWTLQEMPNRAGVIWLVWPGKLTKARVEIETDEVPVKAAGPAWGSCWPTRPRTEKKKGPPRSERKRLPRKMVEKKMLRLLGDVSRNAWMNSRPVKEAAAVRVRKFFEWPRPGRWTWTSCQSGIQVAYSGPLSGR